ncbi:MAG TPA: TldD/PmbA family protein [Candidatus Latescibacteria bacterium]|nr:TldD/PmbA family protein [Candidatus Latescibacterota bacterium]
MKEQEAVLSTLEKVLRWSTADQTEVIFKAVDSYLTRFAQNCVHQNVAERDANLSIRVIRGRKIGSVTTNLLDDESLRAALAKADEIAERGKENPHFRSLPVSAEYPSVRTFDERTAALTPEERTEVARIAIDRARKEHFHASGAFSTGTIQVAVANSFGVRVCQSFTKSSLKIVVQSPKGGSGYAYRLSRRFDDIDARELSDQATEKCGLGGDPVEVQPGEYTVILEPYAVGALLAYLAYIGLGAFSLQEGRSFMCGKFGKEVMGENITLWDDGLDPKGMVVPFDFEGVPKRKVMLIESGVARGVVYDSYTAGREEGRISTGHKLPGPITLGPIPTNLFMKEGGYTVEEMIGSTENGIYVSRFWYTNVLEPVKTLVTGVTRDGTFLIRNGRISRAVKNLRFTESIVRTLSNVSMISRRTRLVEGIFSEFFSGSVVPALKADKFNFTGVAD